MKAKQERALRLIMEAELSHEDIHDALRKALRLQHDRAWCWLEAIFDDHVIYSVESKDPPVEALPQDKLMYQVDYSVDESGVVTLGVPLAVKRVVTYEPVAQAAPATESADEFDLDFVPLVEKAVDRTGTMKVKIIQPGWGSSGYYSEEVLKRDGPKVFTKGLKMFADHPTPTEEAERPERSVRDLVATLVSDATYQEKAKDGPGLYADAQVIDGWRPMVEELAPHIGTSIRALGRAVRGEAEGKKGPIIEGIAAAKSVDLVTAPGAGGKITQLFESARARAQETITIGGEGDVDERQLQEAREAREAAEAKLKEAEEALETERAENARMREGEILREARNIVTAELPAELPELTRDRLVESLSKNPPLAEDKSLDAAKLKESIESAVKDELEYLASVTESGKIKGMGSGAPSDQSDTIKESEEKLGSAFASLGLSESATKTAVAGR